MLLGRQRCVFNEEGLGYTPKNKQKFYKNFFVNEHIADVCPMKKTFYKKNNKGSNPKVVNNWNTHKAWVPKQNKIIKANLHGPKKMWVPKRIT